MVNIPEPPPADLEGQYANTEGGLEWCLKNLPYGKPLPLVAEQEIEQYLAKAEKAVDFVELQHCHLKFINLMFYYSGHGYQTLQYLDRSRQAFKLKGRI